MEQFTLEQQFRILSFEKQVDQMSLEQARQILKQIHRTLIASETLNKELLKRGL